MDDPDRPLKDYGSFVHGQPSEDDIAAHHRERWQDQAMYIGLRYPSDLPRKRRHRHRHQRPSVQLSTEPAATGEQFSRPVTPPSQRVQFLLGREDELEDEDHQAHAMFCEMEELRAVGEDGEKEWKEVARWIKFEEDVEEGGDRWSKPHVATLSLHSLFELRKGILTGTVIFDMNAFTVTQVFDLILDTMVSNGQLSADKRETVQDVMLSRHKHQHQRREGSGVKGLPMIRSLAEIGHRSSEKRLDHRESLARANQSAAVLPTGRSSKDLHGDMPRNSSSVDMSEGPYKYNEHFLKKIPQGAEAANILVGEVECLVDPLVAFVRLQKAVLLADLTEVSVPTRFIFIELGPVGNMPRYHEIGRSIATLMSDEIFHDVAYKARDRNDILAGIDEFMDCVTVLPPGEWDPTIRIEPPKVVPSQEKRKKPDPQKPPNGQMSPIQEESQQGTSTTTAAPAPEEESHGDPTLVRTGRLFGGVINDIKRKAPWYLSDFRDALHVQCVASFFFMYFASLAPIITFGGLLGSATGNYIAAMESLVSGALCGVTYHLFSGQPLTIIGSTGPVLVFESIVYKFCDDNELNYLCFRFWIGMWMCLLLMLIVAFDLSTLVRFITRFTEESFAMLIAIIFIVEAFKKLTHILDHNPVNLHPDRPLDYNCSCLPPWAFDNDTNSSVETTWTPAFETTELSSANYSNVTDEVIPDWSSMNEMDCLKYGGIVFGSGCSTPHYVADVFMLSCLLFIGTFLLAMSLKFFRNTTFFPNQVRVLISDFAVFTAILLMVLTDFFIGLETPKLEVPPEFRPTSPKRGWIVNPFANSWYWLFAGLPPSLLAVILIFMDQQITAVIVNRKENKLRKGSGYHLDLLIITLQIAVCSLIGTPWFVAATVLSINHIRSLTRESESAAPGERPKFLGVREQRVTGTLVFIMIGLSALMANVLKHIPMPVLYGVFLFMGMSSLKGIQFVQRVMIMFMPSKYQPDYMYLRHVPVRRVHLFTAVQIMCFAGLWVIKTIKAISIVFPLMVLAMCFIRKGLDWVFTHHELKWLDDIMPESHKREKEDKKKKRNKNSSDDDLDGHGSSPATLLHVVEMGDATEFGGNVAIVVPLLTPPPPYKAAASSNSHDMNISEEMAKTGIWHHLNSQPRLSAAAIVPPSAPPANEENHLRQRKGKDLDHMPPKDPTVKFRIADEEEDDASSAETRLLMSAPAATASKPPTDKTTDMTRV